MGLGKDTRIAFKQAVYSDSRVKAPRRSLFVGELAAIGNTFGGTLVLGVSDSGAVLDLGRQRMDALETFICEVCESSIRPWLALATQSLALNNRRSMLIMEVEPSTSVHKSPGGCFRRKRYAGCSIGAVGTEYFGRTR